MENLTSGQAADIANCLRELNGSIEEFRFEPKNQLTDTQKKTLDDLMEQVSDAAQQILAESTTLVMEDVNTSLTTIKKITEQIKKTITSVADVQKVIVITASVLTLGTSILSKDPQSI